MAETRPAWMIINPAAGKKRWPLRGTVNPDQVRVLLERHGIAADLHLTERAGHATDLARDAVAAGVDLVIAAGGDGTVHEVACGLVGSPVRLGILPFGSVMNVARALGVPHDLEQAARVIRDGRVVRMDVGKAVTRTRQAYFVELAGIGVDAGVFACTNQIEAGKWRAVPRLLRFLLHYAPRRVRLVVDGKAEVVRAYMITVAITPCAGLAFALAPDAKVDDRQFDVVIREKFGRLEFLRHALSTIGGRRVRHPKARTLRARHVVVEPIDRWQLVHADGLSLGAIPSEFELIPASLSVLVGEPVAGETATVATRQPAGNRSTPVATGG